MPRRLPVRAMKFEHTQSGRGPVLGTASTLVPEVLGTVVNSGINELCNFLGVPHLPQRDLLAS